MNIQEARSVYIVTLITIPVLQISHSLIHSAQRFEIQLYLMDSITS